MSTSASVSALSEWDRPENDQPLAKLTEKQCQILTEIETYMEGKRSFKEVSNLPKNAITPGPPLILRGLGKSNKLSFMT